MNFSNGWTSCELLSNNLISLPAIGNAPTESAAIGGNWPGHG
jgi:hypothetical protein